MLRRNQILFVAFLLVLNANISCIMANPDKVQPVYGFTWHSLTQNIPVRIQPTNQSHARQAVLKAMSTWNSAQQWFIMKYMAGASNPLLFYETDLNFTNLVTVTFNETQTSDGLGNTLYRAWFDAQGVLKKITVSISIDLTSRGGNLTSGQIQAVATHELGHSLGLNHTEFNDLMGPHYLEDNATLPSTLNLYAVYLLGKVHNVKSLPENPVRLPDSIPYAMSPPSAFEARNVEPAIAQESPQLIPEFVFSVLKMKYGPLSIVEILGAFMAVGFVLVPYRVFRNGRMRERELEGVEESTWNPSFIERDTPKNVVGKTSTKVCYHCGSKIARESRICRECELPVVYLGADTHWRL